MNPPSPHLTRDEIERYALASVHGDLAPGVEGEANHAQLEEHLLWCHACVERVELHEMYAVAMRSGAARIEAARLARLRKRNSKTQSA